MWTWFLAHLRITLTKVTKFPHHISASLSRPHNFGLPTLKHFEEEEAEEAEMSDFSCDLPKPTRCAISLWLLVNEWYFLGTGSYGLPGTIIFMPEHSPSSLPPLTSIMYNVHIAHHMPIKHIQLQWSHLPGKCTHCMSSGKAVFT